MRRGLGAACLSFPLYLLLMWRFKAGASALSRSWRERVLSLGISSLPLPHM